MGWPLAWVIVIGMLCTTVIVISALDYRRRTKHAGKEQVDKAIALYYGDRPV